MGDAAEFGREKIANFHSIQQDYKHFGSHGIRADVLISKTPFEGRRPVIVRFHGGGLVRTLLPRIFTVAFEFTLICL